MLYNELLFKEKQFFFYGGGVYVDEVLDPLQVLEHSLPVPPTVRGKAG